MTPSPLLSIRDLRVTFPRRYGDIPVLDEVDLEVGPGEAVAVVGESGCGKSLLGLAAAHLLPSTAKVSGTVAFRGVDVRRMSGRQRRQMRGSGVGIVYQDAMTSLNPGMNVGAQLRQVCRLGSSSTPEQLLDSVGLSDTRRIMHAKPYQLSGGQRQRVLIAIALARDPDLVIADEPTTALDVTVQKQVVELLQSLQRRRHFALLFISHDLALVSEVAARTTVMYAGQMVESGPTEQILARPRHPYTAGLLRASLSLEQRWPTLAPIPGHVRQPAEFATGCRFRDRCAHSDHACTIRPEPHGFEVGALETEGIHNHILACHHPVDPDTPITRPPRTTPTWEEPAQAAPRPAENIFDLAGVVVDYHTPGGHTRALDDVSVRIDAGQSIGLIGESGSGKTTLSRSLLGLVRPTEGQVLFRGSDIYAMRHLPRHRTLSRDTAMVFQDPRSSLNPRLTVGAVIRDPLTVLRIGTRADRDAEVAELLEDVGLSAQMAGRPVRSLSGGQLQRVALARALAVEPSVIVADEPTSALDVSVQAQILNLLQQIRTRRNLAMLVVSHDVRVIRFATEYTAVMLRGEIVEHGPTEQIYQDPQHPYTQSLLTAAPVLSKGEA